MVLVFWFVIGGVLALAYSEVVTRVYTLADPDAPDSVDPDLDARRLAPWQVLGLALSVGAGMLVVRVALQFVYSSFGNKTCAVITNSDLLKGSVGAEVPEDFPPPPQPLAQPLAVPQPPALVRPAPPQAMAADPYRGQ